MYTYIGCNVCAAGRRVTGCAITHDETNSIAAYILVEFYKLLCNFLIGSCYYTTEKKNPNTKEGGYIHSIYRYKLIICAGFANDVSRSCGYAFFIFVWYITWKMGRQHFRMFGSINNQRGDTTTKGSLFFFNLYYAREGYIYYI